jgi:peptidoglycan/xylan/chitin deacetylase (PgdA/CDA1 family)
MITSTGLKGHHLPGKTLCLTFDDGPGQSPNDQSGPKTVEIAKYLFEQNIVATFFMVGKYMMRYPEIPGEIKTYGHLIGNHTMNHYNLSNQFINPVGEIRDKERLLFEFDSTEKLLRNYGEMNTIYFRAPYGAMDTVLMDCLNRELNSSHQYIGAIDWDIDCKDWDYWTKPNNKAYQACAKAYYKKIKKVNHGIVLMHDSSAEEDSTGIGRKNNNKTLETIQILIPKLKEKGYSFIGLDEAFPSR